MSVDFTVATYRVTFLNANRPFVYIIMDDADRNWSARLDFFPVADTTDTTNVTVNNQSRRISLQMPIELLDRIIDILRNEKPVRVVYSSSSPFFYLSTRDEPVGEEETRGLMSFIGARPPAP